MSPNSFIIYALDFEGSLTTGVLEYGWVGIDSQRGIFTATTGFCKNKKHIPEQDFKVHQIKAQRLVKCPDFAGIVPQLVALRKHYFFCAHNAIFEHILLSSYVPIVFSGKQLPESPSNQWGPWVDTYTLYKNAVNQPSYNLQDLVQAMGLQEVLDALGERFCPADRRYYHCALFDALGCALLALHFIREHPELSLFALLRASGSVEHADSMAQLRLFW